MGNLPPIPKRLQKIDELTWLEHHHLAYDDECFYIWERVSGARYDEYATNGLIKNLQIDPSFRDQGRWYWKRQAIGHCARAVSALIPDGWREGATFVPMPPSIVKGETGYDDRLLSVLHAVRPKLHDIRELVLQVENTISKQKQISPQERAANYTVDLDSVEPKPELLIVVDDMLAGASHFAAMKIVLSQQFPGVPVAGLFLARSLRPIPPPEECVL